jgi:hypothetical protein
MQAVLGGFGATLGSDAGENGAGCYDCEVTVGIFVIACYRPKPGKEVELEKVVADHMPVLRAQGLITARPAYVMRAADGTILEVFEWKSREAIEQAHQNSDVHKLWARFAAVCEYEKLTNLAEAGQMFAEFEPVEM